MSTPSDASHDGHAGEGCPNDWNAHRTRLVAVRGLSETVAAGHGNAMLFVRTLDDVSLDVRAGDLVLLTGRVGEGAASLAGALAGRRRIVHGARELHPGGRVRRGSISGEAQQAIIGGWAAGSSNRRTNDDDGRSRTAYVLRVRHGDARMRGCPDGAWFGWARALCESGGAIVLWEVAERWRDTAVGAGGGSAVHEARLDASGPYRGMLHRGVLPEAWSGSDAAVARDHPGRLRAARLIAGRLVPALREESDASVMAVGSQAAGGAWP